MSSCRQALRRASPPPPGVLEDRGPPFPVSAILSSILTLFYLYEAGGCLFLERRLKTSFRPPAKRCRSPPPPPIIFLIDLNKHDCSPPLSLSAEVPYVYDIPPCRCLTTRGEEGRARHFFTGTSLSLHRPLPLPSCPRCVPPDRLSLSFSLRGRLADRDESSPPSCVSSLFSLRALFPYFF